MFKILSSREYRRLKEIEAMYRNIISPKDTLMQGLMKRSGPASEYACSDPECDFESNTERGLNIHKARMHK